MDTDHPVFVLTGLAAITCKIYNKFGPVEILKLVKSVWCPGFVKKALQSKQVQLNDISFYPCAFLTNDQLLHASTIAGELT